MTAHLRWWVRLPPGQAFDGEFQHLVRPGQPSRGCTNTFPELTFRGETRWPTKVDNTAISLWEINQIRLRSTHAISLNFIQARRLDKASMEKPKLAKPLPPTAILRICALQYYARIVRVPRREGADRQQQFAKAAILKMQAGPDRPFQRRPMQYREVGVHVVKIQLKKILKKIWIWKYLGLM